MQRDTSFESLHHISVTLSLGGRFFNWHRSVCQKFHIKRVPTRHALMELESLRILSDPCAKISKFN